MAEEQKATTGPSDEVRSILKQYDDLKSRWTSNWLGIAQELADYLHPRRNQISTKNPGIRQTNKIFKSSPMKALSDLAASIHGALTNPVLRWFKIKMREKPLNDIPVVRKWLEECSERMYMAFQDSNFDSEIQEVYMDLGAFGIGVLYQEEKDVESAQFNGFRFQALQIGDYVIAENADGIVDVLYREFDLTPRSAAAKWGPLALSERTREMLLTKPEEPITIVHAVYPNREGTLLYSKKEKRPWRSVYVEAEAKHIISTGGYNEFPFMVPRWSKAGREIYGRGPGHNALPDVKTLNRNCELRLRALGKIVDPPLIVLDDTVIGSIRLTPGAENTVRQENAIKTLELNPHIRDALVEEERLVNDIDKLFYNDLLALPDKTIITAAEVERRVQQIQQKLGPTIGRLSSELLTKLIERSFGIMFRSGALPEPPQEVVDAAETMYGEIDIEYEGPLSRAQRAGELLSIQRMYELMVPMAQMKPEVMDIVDEDEVARRVIRLSGVPATIERPKERIIEIRQAREAAAAEAEQIEQVKGLAESGGKAAPLLKAMGAMAGMNQPGVEGTGEGGVNTAMEQTVPRQ